MQARTLRSERRRPQPGSVNRLQLLSWFEPYGFAGRDRNFRAGARVPSDTSLSWPDIEHAKAPQLNAITFGQGSLHAFENSFHGRLGLGLGDAGLVDHFVDDVQLNHRRLPAAGSLRSTKWLMLRDITEIVKQQRKEEVASGERSVLATNHSPLTTETIPSALLPCTCI